MEPPVAEVMANIRNNPVGAGTVGDFNLPDEFVLRVADRIYRESYQRQFRAVVDWGGTSQPAAAAPGPASQSSASPFTMEVIGGWSIGRAAPWREAPPPLRGFRVCLPEMPGDWPYEAPSADAPAEEKAAAGTVAARLAADGLVTTTMRALAQLKLAPDVSPAKAMNALRRVGIPVDLLACFEDGSAPAGASDDGATACDGWQPAAERVVGQLVALCNTRPPAGVMEERLATMKFRFRRAPLGFRVASEGGEHPIVAMRAQLPRGDDWIGPGSGGAVDVLRQAYHCLPQVDWTVALEERHLAAFRGTTAGWPHAADHRFGVLTENLSVAQWAQDDAKTGWVGVGSSARVATLAPRFPSRSEDRSVFVAGEAAVIASLPRRNHLVVQSALLFQGGNLVCVDDRAARKRVLLVGEAEIYRNVSLGLTLDQVVAAFRDEFDVDQCVVLPAAGFHLDLELSCRTHEGRVLAFVNDQAAGARAIAACGIEALQRAGLLTTDACAAARAALQSGELRAALDLLVPAVQAAQVGPGQWPMTLARHFSVSAVDSPVGNLRRFLIALDFLMSEALSGEPLAGDEYTRAHLKSIERSCRERGALHAKIAKLGWTLVPVPGFEESGVSVNAINALHDRSRVLVPAYGGLYSPLDEAAQATWRAALGGAVEMIPILCGESQSRVGGVHCSLAASYDSGPRP